MRVSRLNATWRYIAIGACGIVVAFPLCYLISGSLMSPSEIAQYPPKLLPAVPQWSNFAQALDFLTPAAFGNTLIFVMGVLILQLAISLPAGFAMARIPFTGRSVMTLLYLVPVFMPTNLILIPTFVVTYQLGMIGTFFGLIIPIAAQSSVGMLLFRQFFATLPAGLLEAARLDGAGWYRTFFQVAVPLARPMIASYSVVTFLTAWNMYMWPLLAGGGEQTRVLTVALAPLATSQYSNISPAIGFAAAVLAMLPVLVMFVLFQRWFSRGVVGTGLE